MAGCAWCTYARYSHVVSPYTTRRPPPWCATRCPPYLKSINRGLRPTASVWPAAYALWTQALLLQKHKKRFNLRSFTCWTANQGVQAPRKPTKRFKLGQSSRRSTSLMKTTCLLTYHASFVAVPMTGPTLCSATNATKDTTTTVLVWRQYRWAPGSATTVNPLRQLASGPATITCAGLGLIRGRRILSYQHHHRGGPQPCTWKALGIKPAT